MLAKYDTSFLRRTKKCTVWFYLLYVYARSASLQLARLEKRSAISVSQRHGVNGPTN